VKLTFFIYFFYLKKNFKEFIQKTPTTIKMSQATLSTITSASSATLQSHESLHKTKKLSRRTMKRAGAEVEESKAASKPASKEKKNKKQLISVSLISGMQIYE
jgi:hypothetical protein